jgi:sugar/nucleoside kinase (ribokinase family)
MNSSSDSAPEVIVYGTVCLDRFLRVDDAGEPLSAEVQEMPGGEAFNTATALCGWGVQTLLTGTALGSDAESDRLRHHLDFHPLGVSRRYIPDIPDAVTPVCTVSVFPDGERKMSGRGYAQAIAPPPLPKAVFSKRPIYVCDPNLGEAATEAALHAQRFGCLIIAMDYARTPEVVAISRILVTSREMLAKQKIDEEPTIVAQHLVLQGAQTAIITCGPEGSVVFDRDEGGKSFPAFAVQDIQDTTGAGDIFRAGLTLGLLRNWHLEETVRFASAAAALHCRELGGGSRIALRNIFDFCL